MVQKNHSARSGQGAIYTLAQNGTGESDKEALILIGKGSDMTAAGYGKRKGKKKTITQALALAMIDIAKEKGRKDIEQSLWNTWHCQNVLYTHDGRLYGKYCKNRFCTACLSIRKAQLINSYYPVLKDWQDAHFVTLTVKACYMNMLPLTLRKCLQGLKRIINRYNKQHQRGKGKKLIAIRSLECNFNPHRRTYNPHFHLIVPDRETAEILKAEWLKIWTPKFANKLAQHFRPVENLEKDLIEVIKYGTKVFTDETGKEKPKGIVKLYVRAFYNIIEAMQGLRLFGSYGIKLTKDSKEERTPAQVVTDYHKWQYITEDNDWQHTESELTLFGYTPDELLKELLRDNIDTVLE